MGHSHGLPIGSGLIATSVALSGTPAGIYSAMYIWVVLVAARSFSYFGLTSQLLGILATYGIALSTLDTGPTEFANSTRWLLSVFALTVTGIISLRLVSDARDKEAELTRLSDDHRSRETQDQASTRRDSHQNRLEAAPGAGSLAEPGR